MIGTGCPALKWLPPEKRPEVLMDADIGKGEFLALFPRRVKAFKIGSHVDWSHSTVGRAVALHVADLI